MRGELRRVAITLLVTVALGACVDGGAPVAPGTTSARGGSGAGGGGALVGEWSRTVIFAADDGDIHTSRTIWWFDSSGTAERWVIAGSVAAGFADTVTATARWDASGTRVTISYQPPDTGTVTFDYAVRSDTLTLGEEEYIRDD